MRTQHIWAHTSQAHWLSINGDNKLLFHLTGPVFTFKATKAFNLTRKKNKITLGNRYNSLTVCDTLYVKKCCCRGPGKMVSIYLFQHVSTLHQIKLKIIPLKTNYRAGTNILCTQRSLWWINSAHVNRIINKRVAADVRWCESILLYVIWCVNRICNDHFSFSALHTYVFARTINERTTHTHTHTVCVRYRR